MKECVMESDVRATDDGDQVAINLPVIGSYFLLGLVTRLTISTGKKIKKKKTQFTFLHFLIHLYIFLYTS